jgi:hypothetical protein
LALTHVGEDHAGALFDWISLVTNRIAKVSTAIRFPRHINDLAVHVEQPTVIDAA